MVNPGPMVPWWLPLIQKPLHIRKSCAMKLELVVSSWAQLQLFHVAHLERLLHNHHPTVTPIHVMPTSVIARIWVYIYIHCHHGFHNMDNVRMVSQRLFFPAPRLQVSYPDVDMQLEPSLEKQFIQHLTCNKGHSHNVLCVVIIFIMSRTDMIRPAIPHFHQWKPPCLNGKHEDLDTALLVSRSSYL